MLVTVARDGTLLDHRRVELVDDGLPKLPHHSEGQGLPLDDAVVARRARPRIGGTTCRARTSDRRRFVAVPDIGGIALRERQPLPPTIAERIKNYRASNVADWVMYRTALA